MILHNFGQGQNDVMKKANQSLPNVVLQLLFTDETIKGKNQSFVIFEYVWQGFKHDMICFESIDEYFFLNLRSKREIGRSFDFT